MRELRNWYLYKKARCYGNHHQYRLHNFKGCLTTLVSDYSLTRQQAVDVLKICIKLHVDTLDTSNWYIKYHNGLEYLNMVIVQVTDNPVMVDGSSLHHDVSQRIQTYIHTYILPLHRVGKIFNEKSILNRIKTRLNRDFDIMGEGSVLNIV